MCVRLSDDPPDEALLGLGGTLWSVMICLQGFRWGGAALSGISEQTAEHLRSFSLCKHVSVVMLNSEGFTGKKNCDSASTVLFNTKNL